MFVILPRGKEQGQDSRSQGASFFVIEFVNVPRGRVKELQAKGPKGVKEQRGVHLCHRVCERVKGLRSRVKESGRLIAKGHHRPRGQETQGAKGFSVIITKGLRS